jgi:hypothetical protein
VVSLALVCALVLAAGGVRAELWAYIDGQGVAHFASRAVDERYQRIDAGARGGAARSGRVAGKTDAASAVMTWLEIAPEVKAVQAWLREASRRYGVDIELLKALIAVESSFKPEAVSPRGALGLMQIMPETADRYATAAERQRPAQQRMLEPRTNILTGARMLADLLRRHRRIEVALAAWNAGEGRVARHGGGLPPIAETQAHVHLVLELYWALLQRSQAKNISALRVQAMPASASRPP